MGKGKAFERFLREATILEQFRHPNIVRYLARGKSGGTYYYAMEYVTGPTLDTVIVEQEGRSPGERWCPWASSSATPSSTPTSTGSSTAT